MEQVNHPKHYNQHPAGIECIEIIRHYACDIANAIKYLWRAGLKTELGKEDAEKEIEDLKKALWYIEDYRKYMPSSNKFKVQYGSMFFSDVTGFDLYAIITPYDAYISEALNCLFYLGVIKHDMVYNIEKHDHYLSLAIKDIQRRIYDIEQSKTTKE